jgi:GTP-binding protein HflX
MEVTEVEKVILVGLKLKQGNDYNFLSSMEELKALTEAAGGEVVGTLIQSKDRPSASTYIGKGKLDELQHLTAELEPDLVIFDSELSPVQLRNLEQALDIRIIDRTMLILDIFGQRARSKEGIMQIELARLEYSLPRLTGKGVEMSRLGGGIGTRGAGEQKLELDKRRIRNQIFDIKKQMQKMDSTRKLHRKHRQRAGLKSISLVGYTNAGKSSLFNSMCSRAHRSGSEQVEANARLFQTLDTTTRKIILPSKSEALITDTVGFIQNLPHHMVAAFRSTLEETVDADILLHVVDAADPDHIDKMEVAVKLLEELGADLGKIITVFNKADLLDFIPDNNMNAYFISAKSGSGIDEILSVIERKIAEHSN